ncbi:LacI family DNA-binding transcriptional regulator [soil metagenome]
MFAHMSVTLADIGEQLGISHQVVSKTMNGGKSTVVVSKELERRIRETAARMGYRPSTAGRSLRLGRTMSIGILVGPSEDFLLSPDTLVACVKTLSERGYSTTLFSAEGTSEADYLKSPLLSERSVDALLVSYAHEPSPAFEAEIARLPMPVIWLNRKTASNALSVDERGAARQLAEHLLELGHRHIAFLDYSSGLLTDSLIAERLSGMRDALEESGAILSIIQKRLARTDRSEHAQTWLKSETRPTAIIANSLTSAQAVCQTALGMGLALPGDLAVASFDNGQGHLANVPVITCAIRPDAEFGRMAAKMIFDQLDQPDRCTPGHALPFAISLGGSTLSQKPNPTKKETT